jgi:ankyrin repeat protein
VDIVEFLMDNNADVNKQNPKSFSSLHCAIYGKQINVCSLILKYEQVSNQNIESGITLSKIYDTPEIRKLLEKAIKKRRKVILVCFFFRLTVGRALLILNSLKRYAVSASKFLRIAKSVANARLLFIVVGYGVELH